MSLALDVLQSGHLPNLGQQASNNEFPPSEEIIGNGQTTEVKRQHESVKVKEGKKRKATTKNKNQQSKKGIAFVIPREGESCKGQGGGKEKAPPSEKQCEKTKQRIKKSVSGKSVASKKSPKVSPIAKSRHFKSTTTCMRTRPGLESILPAANAAFQGLHSFFEVCKQLTT